MTASHPMVGLVMGSKTDWEVLQYCADTLTSLGVNFESSIVSAHRTPDRLYEYASHAATRGLQVIIAGAGGAAHLPGMIAAKTNLPVLGVPIPSTHLSGMDSLLSIVQMPAGCPVGTLAIGRAGAINAAILSASILGLQHPSIAKAVAEYRAEETARILANTDPRK